MPAAALMADCTSWAALSILRAREKRRVIWLTPSVLTWRHVDGRQGYCAVRQGVLSVRGGREVAVATRQAQLGTDLETLERTVIDRFTAEDEAERAARVAATRLHMEAIRRIIAALRPEQAWPGAAR